MPSVPAASRRPPAHRAAEERSRRRGAASNRDGSVGVAGRGASRAASRAARTVSSCTLGYTSGGGPGTTANADAGCGVGALTGGGAEGAGLGGGTGFGTAAGDETQPQQQRRQEQDDLEARWQAYLQGEEFLTFHAVMESLMTLPPVGQLAERRADFELLLHLLHRLGRVLEVEHVSKNYRAHYSPDVQLSGYLYSTLLTAFTLLPSYVLNGQEFYVSDTVLDQCKALQIVFEETCAELRRQFDNLQPYSLEHIRHDVRRSLAYFDRSWCRFEMPALEEIEAIHKQACRPLIEAIEVEQALTQWEKRSSNDSRTCPPGAHKTRGHAQRARLMEKVNELNRLANVDGKGRSDMDLPCLLEAERISAKPMCAHLRGGAAIEQVAAKASAGELPPLPPPPGVLPALALGAKGASNSVDARAIASMQPAQHKCSGCVSPVLLRIAKSLLRAFDRLRRILHRYARCLYQLNSHLANNPDLVKALERFEAAWETASRYLVQAGPKRLALLSYDIVAGIREPGFEAALTSLDPGFLVASLPRAFLLHEMQRFIAARSAALAQKDETAPALPLAPLVKPQKGEASAAVAKPSRARSQPLVVQLPPIAQQPDASAQGREKVSCMLPRPLEKGRISEPPASAFKFSAISRSFLPPEVAADYDMAAAALGRLSEARLGGIRHQLLASSATTSPVGSSGSSPSLQAAQQLPKQLRVQSKPSSSNGVVAAASAAPTAERPPLTPCPPRMAVPNSGHGRAVGTGVVPVPTSPALAASMSQCASSGATSSGAGGAAAVGPGSPKESAAPTVVIADSGAQVQLIEEEEEDSSDDDAAFAIDLTIVDVARLQSGGSGPVVEANVATVSPQGPANAEVAAGNPADAFPSTAGCASDIASVGSGSRCGADGVALGVGASLGCGVLSRLGTGRLSTGRLGTGRCGTGRCGTGRCPTDGPGASGRPILCEDVVVGDRGAPDPDARQVVSLVSTLALHLQRSKPHEWNELIQVVLQGLLLAKSAGGASCGTAAHEVQTRQSHRTRARGGSNAATAAATSSTNSRRAACGGSSSALALAK